MIGTTNQPKEMLARFAGRCGICGKSIRAGQWITWSREQGPACVTMTAGYGHIAAHPPVVSVEVEAPGALRTTISRPVESGLCRRCGTRCYGDCTAI